MMQNLGPLLQPKVMRNLSKFKQNFYLNSIEIFLNNFRDIVDASHLKPISKQDKMNSKTKNRLWNSAASE